MLTERENKDADMIIARRAEIREQEMRQAELNKRLAVTVEVLEKEVSDLNRRVAELERILHYIFPSGDYSDA